MANVAPPPGVTRAEAKELNRRRLLEAARSLLIECGYGALSARQVSARAGVAQSSFYAHFRDKEDLVRTLAGEIFSRLRTQLRESRRSESAGGWDEMLNRTLLRLYEFFLAERELVALLFQELDQPGSPINDIGQEVFDTLHRDFEEDLTQLIAEGRVPPLPVEATVIMVIGSATYMLRRILRGRLTDPLSLFFQVGELNRAMLRGLETRS
jgi:AcrR family transcriptional regulator